MNNELHSVEMIERGNNNQRGNLLGIQSFMTTADYVSGAAFFAKLNSYLESANQRGWINERTIVIWPEYIGAWLVIAGESRRVYEAENLNDAMLALALRHIPQLVIGLLSAKEKDKLAASLFRTKAASMATLYHSTFSALAKKYSATIVAGSILLPAPKVRDGIIIAGKGSLYNVSAVYKSNGLAYPNLTYKLFPIASELDFVAAAPTNEFFPAFDTPAGRLGVMVCADSWYPEPYQKLKSQNVDFIAVPSYIPESDVWDKPWQGYTGASAPEDVDKADVGRLTEGQGWKRYALSGRIQQAGTKSGMTVFLRGSLWNLHTDGRSILAVNGDAMEVKSNEAAIINLWL